jgi:hypothetical protein
MTKSQVVPFRPKLQITDMTPEEMERYYIRRIRELIDQLTEARARWDAQKQPEPAPTPPERKRPLLFAVPIFDPPRKRARKPKPSDAPRVLEPA